MPKVVTSEGLTEFVQSGKFNKVDPHKPGAAPPLEVVKAAPTLELKPLEKQDGAPTGQKSPTAPPVAVEHDEALTDDEKALPDKAQKEIIRSKRAVNEKHRLMKEAQEAAAESDRFAETLYNQNRLAEQRARAAEEKLKELQAKEAPKQPELKEPTRAEFTDAAGQIDWDKYTDAKADYRARIAIKEERERESQEVAERAREARIAQMRINADKVREQHPDFDETMSELERTGKDKVPRFVLDFIEETEHSAQVAYHLATHEDVREKLSKMTPRMGTAELGVIQAALVKPPSEAPSPRAESVTTRATNGGAPAPIIPLDGEGSGGIQTDPSKMSYKELRAYHRTKDAEKRRR
jgi:hypothetical protein